LTKSGNHTDIKLINKKNIRLQKKQKKGGQSAQRIGRIRQEKEYSYIKNAAELAVNTYLKNNKTEYIIKGLLIGGPAEIKQKIVSNSTFKQYFDKKIIKIVSTQKIVENTVWNVYNRHFEAFITEENREVVELIKKTKSLMHLCDNKLIFGYREAVDNLKMCLVEYLLIDEHLDKKKKKELYGLNTYSCKIYEIDKKIFNIDIIGIKWY